MYFESSERIKNVSFQEINGESLDNIWDNRKKRKEYRYAEVGENCKKERLNETLRNKGRRIPVNH